ncbi:MAG: SusC/RagA family TonB-linked outer membrane protein [Tannerellaceae bacterium]|jgi:TonB-linked SusC/RagA family outer membrane protein|nr:SusC/RagA family TonB-linked outer membrane protein [Tannerellaceae bacterium]
MSNAFILLVFITSNLSAALRYSDATRFDLNLKNTTLEIVFDEIKRNSEFSIIFKSKDVNLKDLVSVEVQQKTVDEVLNQVLKNQHLSYEIKEKHIIIYKKNAPYSKKELINLVAQQSGKTVRGKVVDATGVPLPGVNIRVKGTTTGVITDTDGNYSITAPDNAVLSFSFIGYTTQDIQIKERTEINVEMADDTQLLDEIVVTALGIKRQAKALGYSTTIVSGDNFTESRDINIGNSLTGKIAGVSVANNATGIGGSSRVIIRGNASLTGNNQPLYVIDGVPFDNTNQGSAGTWGGLDMGDGLNNINPDDIADIQVLKGVAASALYGYRGGNGAILITTKSGAKSAGYGLEFNNNFTLNPIYDYRDYQQIYGQGLQGSRPASASSAKDSYASSWGEKMDGGKAINFLGNEYDYTMKDNWKNFYNTGLTNQTSIAFSGKNDNISYRIGLSNMYDKGILPNSDFRQQMLNLNTTYKISPKLQLNLTANYTFDKIRNRTNLSDGNGNVNATLLYLANSFDVKWLEPAVNDMKNELIPGNSVYFNNPYFLLYNKTNTTNKNRLTGGLTLRYDITDWLYAQGQITRDGYIMNFRNVQPTGAAADTDGFLNEYERNFEELNISYLIGLNKKVSDLSIGINIGGNKQKTINKAYGTDGNVRPFLVPYFYSANNVGNRPYARQYAEYHVNSAYGTAEIGFKDYLFLNLTGRNDWFSTLSSESNSYFYPSASASFVFSDAFEMPSWIYSGKVRISYAQGSNGTSPYQNALTYTLETYKITGQSAGRVNNYTIPNANLKPVQIQEWEAGANMQFFDNRLGLDFAVYKKTTTDDIVTVTTSTASGYSSAIMNVGEVQNKGLETMIHLVPIASPYFRWNSSINFSYNQSEVIYLGGVSNIQISGASARNGSVVVSNIVGQSYGQIVGYKYKTDAAGNRIYDKEGLPLRSDEVSSLGNGVPRFSGGFRNELTYKNLTFMFLLDFKAGAKLFSGTNLSLYNGGFHKTTLQGRENGYVGPGVTEDGSRNTVAVDAQKYWQEVVSRSIGEEFVYSSDFIKLRELSIGYHVPQSLIKDNFIKSMYVSLIGRNLWTILKHTPNIDPESAYNNTNGQGLELNGYPISRSIGINLNLKF